MSNQLSDIELSEIEAKFRDLDEAIADLSRRLSAIEHGSAVADHQPDISTVGTGDVQVPRGQAIVALSLVGRTFIVLAGAFLLRALSESGLIPGRTGAMLGLAYAILWLAAADRQTGAPTQLSRLFHGLAAMLIALPLLSEATTRFHFFSPPTAAGTLGIVVALALAVAYHRRLQILAGVTTVGAAIAMPVLAIATDSTGPFALLAIGVVAGTWVLGETRKWRWLAWPAGLAELFLAGTLVARALHVPPLESAATALAVLTVLLIVATAPFVIRAYREIASVRVFDAAHAALAAPISLVGLMGVSHSLSAIAVAIVGVVLIGAGAVLYTVGFARVLPRQGAGRNFYTATSVALAYVVVGASQLLSPMGLSVLLSILGVVALLLSGWFDRALLAVHATLSLAVAAIASTLLGATLAVWAGSPPVWPSITGAALAALVALVAAAVYGITRPPSTPRWLGVAAYVLLSVLALGALGGALLIWLGPSVAGVPAVPSVLATMKTGLLAGSAVLLAGIGRRRQWREIGSMAYLALAVGALQVIVEGISVTRASTLVVALAMYGSALVAASRLLRRST